MRNSRPLSGRCIRCWCEHEARRSELNHTLANSPLLRVTVPIHKGDEKYLANVLETGRSLRVSGCAGGIGDVTLPLVIMTAK